MKTLSEKQKFIELRAQGLSFEKISQQIRISKPTLIKWNAECHKEITNLKYFEIESLIDQYGITSKARIEGLAVLLEKALSALKNRSFDGITAKDLMSMIFQLDIKIKSELASYQYFTGEYQTPLDDVILDCLKEKTLPFVY